MSEQAHPLAIFHKALQLPVPCVAPSNEMPDPCNRAGRARENKLQPAEYSGGSFTISNLGMFGVSEFSAIINPPQACILAVGGSRQRHSLDAQGRLVGESYMTATLSADNRVVDETTAAQFLESFAFHIENPALLMGS